MRYSRDLLLVIFFSIIFLNTFAEDRVLILNYSKLTKLNIDNLEISTKNPEIAKVINDEINKKYFLNIIDIFNENDIEIDIKYNWKSYIHNYRYTPIYLQNFDISNNVKIKRLQKKPLSCELSVAADILTYLKKKNINENEVLKNINKTNLNQLPYIYNDKVFWGNPNLWFVGYIDYYGDKNDIKPSQRDMTWYWVYEKPMALVYEKYWLTYDIITWENHSNKFSAKNHLTYLLKNLVKWNMVQLWWDWCTKDKYDDWTIDKIEMSQEKADKKIYAKNFCVSTLDDRKFDWYYIEDFKIKKHTWLIWEHAFYLLWYEWWVNNPTKIIVWDSDTGKHIYDIEEWMRKWSLMDYKSIVINKP